MAQEYYAILTNAGLAYEAQQKAQNKPITLTAMAIGDGNGAAYNPDPAAVALRREVHRQPLNALLQDANNPTWLVCEAVLADNVGGWTIREVGIYTDTGILYSIAKYADSVKPLLSTGSGKQFYVRAIFQTSNAASVTLLVDNSVVMAPRSFVIDHVRDELAKRDHKQSVRVATVEPITLSGEQIIDGLAVVAGDRVLVKDQAAVAANGIYVAAAGVWTRATDADSGAKLNPGATVPVESGVINADTQWVLKTDGQVVLGTTALVFQWTGGQNAPTPAAGDRSPKVASTAFVLGEVGNFSGLVGVSEPTILTAADAGKRIVGSNTTITLPATNTLQPGRVYSIFAYGPNGVTVQRAGADTFTPGGGVSGLVSVFIPSGAECVFVAEPGMWEVTGTGALKYSTDFGCSLAGDDYQKLPSGRIIQFGKFVAPSNSVSVVPLPIAFPNAFDQVLISVRDNGQAYEGAPVGGAIPLSKNTFGLRSFYIASELHFSYIALGR